MVTVILCMHSFSARLCKLDTLVYKTATDINLVNKKLQNTPYI